MIQNKEAKQCQFKVLLKNSRIRESLDFLEHEIDFKSPEFKTSLKALLEDDELQYFVNSDGVFEQIVDLLIKAQNDVCPIFSLP